MTLAGTDFDEDVIYDVELTTGRTLRGYFREDHGVPAEMISLTLYDNNDQTKPERWLYLNPEQIVSVQVWLD